MYDTNYHSSLRPLIDAVHHERFRNVQKLKTLSEELLEKSHDLNDKFGELFALNHLGKAYATLQDKEATYETSTRALNLADDLNHPQQMAQVLNNMLWFYRHTGQIEKAIEANYKIRAIAEDLDDYELRCTALVNETVITLPTEQMSFDATRDNFLTVVEYSQREDVRIPASMGLLNLSYIYLVAGDYEEARTYAEQGFETAMETEHAYGQVWGALNLSSILAYLKLFDEAHEMAKRGNQLAEHYHILVHQAISHIGFVYKHQQAYAKAIDYFKQSEEEAIASGDQVWLITVRKELMETYQTMHDYEHALHYTHEYYQTKQRVYDDNTKLQIQILKREHEERERLERLRLAVILDVQKNLATTKRHILTRLAHEFRTPLTTIKTSTQIIERYREKLTGEQHKRHVGNVYQQIETILSLLDDILDVLRDPTEYAGNMSTVHHAQLLVETAIKRAYEKLNQPMDERITVDYAVEIIKTDGNLLQQILMHLLTNALKFSKGAVQLTIVSLEDAVEITVEDSGVGIPEAEYEKIFELLVRGSNIDEIGGNGLGLAVVKNYVHLLGGKIDVESALNKYTRMRIHLPQ
ncbi:MAG: HAMP domain-containing sensor histidine kinase [Chloroflexota bacterium]